MNQELNSQYKKLQDACKETIIFMMYEKASNDIITDKLMGCFSIMSLLEFAHKKTFHKYLLSLFREIVFYSVEITDEKKNNIIHDLIKICDKLDIKINENINQNEGKTDHHNLL